MVIIYGTKDKKTTRQECHITSHIKYLVPFQAAERGLLVHFALFVKLAWGRVMETEFSRNQPASPPHLLSSDEGCGGSAGTHV
jgi:hypothetical protein